MQGVKIVAVLWLNTSGGLQRHIKMKYDRNNSKAEIMAQNTSFDLHIFYIYDNGKGMNLYVPTQAKLYEAMCA